MARDIDEVIEAVRVESRFHLSPVLRQVIINRLEFEPTDGEIKRAREQVMGRTPANAS